MRLRNYLFRSATTAGVTLGAIMAFKYMPEIKEEMSNLFDKTDFMSHMKSQEQPQRMMNQNVSPEVMEIKEEVSQLKDQLDNLFTTS